MQTSVRALAALLAVAALAAAATIFGDGHRATAANGDTVWNVTIENLTSGQPLSPPALVVHDASADVFDVGSAASAGVRAIAEDGNTAPLAAALSGAAGVHDVVALGGPIPPGGSATVTVQGPPGSLLSVVTMLICTNDGFTGVDSWTLPSSASAMADTDAYDAGTEVNSEMSEDLVDACGAAGPVSFPNDGNAHTAEGGVIAAHGGITGGADLTVADHGWTDPVARITAAPVSTVSYTVAIDNLTTGQPLTPPVIAAHNSSAIMWRLGQAASSELSALAENGNNAPIVAALNANPNVYNVEVLGSGPILGGERLVATFDAPSTARISIASMLICTNDGFTGLDSVSIGAGINTTRGAYDAGSEANTELAIDLVPPCGQIGPVSFTGGGGHSQPESNVISMHPGIQGGGVLTSLHAWTGPVVKIQVTTESLDPPPSPSPTATPTSTTTPSPTASPTPSATATATATTAATASPTATATTPAPGPPDTGTGVEPGSGAPAALIATAAAAAVLAGASALGYATIRKRR